MNPPFLLKSNKSFLLYATLDFSISSPVSNFCLIIFFADALWDCFEGFIQWINGNNHKPYQFKASLKKQTEFVDIQKVAISN